jgi:hypothetical protein
MSARVKLVARLLLQSKSSDCSNTVDLWHSFLSHRKETMGIKTNRNEGFVVACYIIFIPLGSVVKRSEPRFVNANSLRNSSYSVFLITWYCTSTPVEFSSTVENVQYKYSRTQVLSAYINIHITAFYTRGSSLLDYKLYSTKTLACHHHRSRSCCCSAILLLIHSSTALLRLKVLCYC